MLAAENRVEASVAPLLKHFAGNLAALPMHSNGQEAVEERCIQCSQTAQKKLLAELVLTSRKRTTLV